MWLNVIHSLFENFQGVLNFKPVSGFLHASIDNFLGKLFFALMHHAVNQLLNWNGIVQTIRLDVSD
jgi:hypothetical protein